MNAGRKNAITPLNVHFAIVAILVVVNLVFATRLLLAWHTLRADNSNQIAQDQAQLRTLQLQTLPLRGLPQKVSTSKEQALGFYERRVPANYSSVLEELGNLAQKNNVRLSRNQYAQAPAIRDLLEIRMDASVSGDYTSIMRFINSIERDKMFFTITGLTLNGSQGGQVNLRLRLTTYLHGAGLDRMAPPAVEGMQASGVTGEGQ